jgi:hypothetical protein
LLFEAQKSWELCEFARFGAFLHLNCGSGSCVDDPGVHHGARKYLPECLQIHLYLLPVFGTLATALEFEEREHARSGLDETVDRSAYDSPVQ